MKKKNNKIIIMVVISLIVAIVGFYVCNKLCKDNKVPNYDFNATWSCSKTDSDPNRTYTFKENGEVRAELDSNPEDNYLVGTYEILDSEIDVSVYSGEREGKTKHYDLNISFNEYVENGVDKSKDSVKWYVEVYNGNYMRLTLPGGNYHCTMK